VGYLSSALHKRLQRLEELLAARVNPPIWGWAGSGDAEAELKRLVADGEIAERDLSRVTLWRWLTQEEAIARGMEMPPEPPAPQPYVPPQLPAPPERKLLAPPAEPSAPKDGSEDDPYERRPVVLAQPRDPAERFHWPVDYPKRAGI
jgi:hypothetical protein